MSKDYEFKVILDNSEGHFECRRYIAKHAIVSSEGQLYIYNGGIEESAIVAVFSKWLYYEKELFGETAKKK